MAARVPGVEFIGGPRRTGEDPEHPRLLRPGRGRHDRRRAPEFQLRPRRPLLRRSQPARRGRGAARLRLLALRQRRHAAASSPSEPWTPTICSAPDETVGVPLSAAAIRRVNDEGRWARFTAYGKPVAGIGILGSVTKRNSGDIELGDGDDAGEQRRRHHRRASVKVDYRLHRVPPPRSLVHALRQHRRGAELTARAASAALTASKRTSQTDTCAPRLPNTRIPTTTLLDLDVTLYYTDFQVDALRLDELGGGPEGENCSKRDGRYARLPCRQLARASRCSDDAGHRLHLWRRGATATRRTARSADRRPRRRAGRRGRFHRRLLPGRDRDRRAVRLRARRPADHPRRMRFDYLFQPTARSPTATRTTPVSPRLGLSYLPTDWSMVFGSYGEAFRAPTFDELYLDGRAFPRFPSGPGIVNRFVPNPDLQAAATPHPGVRRRRSISRTCIADRDRLPLEGFVLLHRRRGFRRSRRQPAVALRRLQSLHPRRSATAPPHRPTCPTPKLWGSRGRSRYTRMTA